MRILALLLLFLGILFFSEAIDSRLELSASSEESGDTTSPRRLPSDFFISRREFSICKLRDFRVSREAEQLKGQSLVDYVNRHQDLWTASLNEKFAALRPSVITGMMGVKRIGHSVEAKRLLGKSRFLDIQLPERFDARENWPNCASIRAIRDQSSCGSCWAFGAVEAMSDRICIASGGQVQVTLSADDLLSCCDACGFGCNGGEPLEAWKFWVEEGIVTGSNYTTHGGCRPYPFPPCEHHSTKHHFKPCKKELYPTPKCEKKCQADYTAQSGKTYAQDKFYGRSAYAVDSNEKALMTELYTNGPIEVAFEVYEDFLNYEKGVYVHMGGKLEGGHAVKLVGWGKEGDVPYWTIANSWNEDFGEDGFFRIVRGRDECGIESGGVAGLPKITASMMNQQSGNERVLYHGRHQHHEQRQENTVVDDGDVF